MKEVFTGPDEVGTIQFMVVVVVEASVVVVKVGVVDESVDIAVVAVVVALVESVSERIALLLALLYLRVPPPRQECSHDATLPRSTS